MANDSSTSTTRRNFLKASVAAGVGAMATSQWVHAAGDDIIRVGLVGCGGRGSGAAVNAMNADPQVHLVAMADVFEDKVTGSCKRLKEAKPDQAQVDDEHCFSGFDGYKKVLESDIDVVLIATSSRFHPQYLKAGIEAGKHVFVEKPHGVDAPGLKSVTESCKLAKEKGLSVVSGLCWRYHTGVQETMKRILDGAIGDVVAVQESYLRTPYRVQTRAEGLTELEWQLRNWYHFNWLSGDDILQSLVHSLDKAGWVTGDKPPVSAFGVGGRIQCVESHFGDQFDHTAVSYEYENGVRVYGFSRAQANVFNQTTDIILGSKGRCDVTKHRIEGETNWSYDGPKCNMYDAEHVAMFEAIRKGEPINNGDYMVNSTMLGLLGRMVCYTGKRITWQEAVDSQEVLGPAELNWDTTPPLSPREDGSYACPIPGFAEFK